MSESNCHARESGHPVTTGFRAVLQSQARGYWIARSSRAMTPNLKHLFLAASLRSPRELFEESGISIIDVDAIIARAGADWLESNGARLSR
jgi:hypothetical protein